MAINSDLFQLVIRGKVKHGALDECRNLHNETAGNPQGVAAARALGDLSHNVFVPLADDSAIATELLFLDSWNSLDGMQKFFSDAQVQGGANLMFETRDPVIGALADSPCYSLLAPKDRTQRFVGLVRGAVKSKAATHAFLAGYAKAINALRITGLVSHQMFYRIDAADELIGIDLWHDADAMQTAYASETGGFSELFTAKPATSMWKQPTGHWVEW